MPSGCFNLYDCRNRVYRADLGRFLQTNPLRFSAGDVNIYRYCGNDPVNNADAMGLITGQGICQLNSNDPSGAYDSNGDLQHHGTMAVDDDGTGSTHDDFCHRNVASRRPRSQLRRIFKFRCRKRSSSDAKNPIPIYTFQSHTIMEVHEDFAFACSLNMLRITIEGRHSVERYSICFSRQISSSKYRLPFRHRRRPSFFED
jgi:hypothetical protein